MTHWPTLSQLLSRPLASHRPAAHQHSGRKLAAWSRMCSCRAPLILFLHRTKSGWPQIGWEATWACSFAGAPHPRTRRPRGSCHGRKTPARSSTTRTGSATLPRLQRFGRARTGWAALAVVATTGSADRSHRKSRKSDFHLCTDRRKTQLSVLGNWYFYEILHVLGFVVPCKVSCRRVVSM